MLLNKYLAIILLFISSFSYSQQRILIDDDFSDWDVYSDVHFDKIGDAGSSGIDLGRLKISNDEDYLFIYIEVGKEINLQDNNDITLYIDTDNNTSSGQNIDGIGADLVYNLGERRGTTYINNNSNLIFHNDIGLISASTVSNNKFEIAISRNSTFSDAKLFNSESIKIILKDNSFNGDRLPNGDAFVSYNLSYDQLPSLPKYQILKEPTADFRILSYNVLRDDLFSNSKTSAYNRILKSINPDIIGFQEIYDHSSEEVADRVQSFIGGEWHHAQQGPDNHAISRYPIIESFFIPGYNNSAGNGGFLIDLPDNEEHLLFIVAHTPCCDNDQGRQAEVDAIMGFIRDAVNGTNGLTLSQNSPIIIVGDMNLVGDAMQLETFLTGNIQNTAKYGPKFKPDWDESNLEDAKPYATGIPMALTWFDEGSSFSPGRLDFTIYTGSVLEKVNAYSLFTRGLPTDSLEMYNLNAEDTPFASDHLPQVTDFRIKMISSTVINPTSTNLIIYPNPSPGVFTLDLDNYHGSKLDIQVINNQGKIVYQEASSYRKAGKGQIKLDFSFIHEGVYYLQLLTNDNIITNKITIVK